MKDENSKNKGNEQMEFYVYGMKCQKNCARKVIECLQQIDGVEEIRLDFSQRKFEIDYDVDNIVDIRDKIFEKIAMLGYEVTFVDGDDRSVLGAPMGRLSTNDDINTNSNLNSDDNYINNDLNLSDKYINDKLNLNYNNNPLENSSIHTNKDTEKWLLLKNHLEDLPSSPESTKNHEWVFAKFSIIGMHCGSCANKIEKHFHSIPSNIKQPSF